MNGHIFLVFALDKKIYGTCSHYWGERWLPDKGESWEGVLKGKERINLIDEEATLGDILTTEKEELLVGYLKWGQKYVVGSDEKANIYLTYFSKSYSKF